MDDEARTISSPTNTQSILATATPTGGNTSSLVSMTSFLEFMQRRLSDFVAPDPLSHLRTDTEGQQSNSTEDALAIVDGLESAQGHNSDGADSNHHKGSPSVHRAG